MIPYALDGTFPDGNFLFQQDLSPVHTAKIVEELLNMRGCGTSAQNAGCDCRARSHDPLLRRGDRFICFAVPSLEFLLLNIMSADAPSVQQQPPVIVSIDSHCQHPFSSSRSSKHNRRSYRPE
ncbi:hypothetical protein HPB52_004688 [Rhipicephalus sanguineus]|uniref:Uncharacterized protein n=1 Tax=Rhipicephalus sanguineus TaxID=34632 RepID=A0A9D4QHQ4_RHISA|nr:hypothetical protein HPB52_004688 [Rhipicephalus sanguineus]